MILPTLAIVILFFGLFCLWAGKRAGIQGGADTGLGILCVIAAVAMLLLAPNAKAAEAPPAADGKPAETWVVIKLQTLEQIALRLQAQAAEILRLRGLLKAAEQPKECI